MLPLWGVLNAPSNLVDSKSLRVPDSQYHADRSLRLDAENIIAAAAQGTNAWA